MSKVTLENTPRSPESKYVKKGQEKFDRYVGYLENTDFNTRGEFIGINLGDKPLLIMIQADWCGACKHMKPFYAEVAEKVRNEGLPMMLTTIDYDENANLLNRITKSDHFPFEVDGFPTLVLYRDGKYVKHKTGAMQSAQDIIDFAN